MNSSSSTPSAPYWPHPHSPTRPPDNRPAPTPTPTLYDEWKAQGPTSVQDAYAVGVALEQADIADLEKLLARNPDADVQRVFTHLLAGSQHHLAAFTNAVNGGSDAAFRSDTGERLRAQLGDRGDGQGIGMGDGTGMGAGYRMGRSDN